MDRRLFALVATLAVASSGAGGRVPLDEYAEEMRGHVVAKVKEALERKGAKTELAGVVTLASDGRFFLHDGGAIKVLCAGALPSVGDVVAVSGAPTLEGGRVVFQAAKWAVRAKGELPTAQPVTSAELTDPAPSGGVNGRRVTMEGRAIGVTEGGFALTVDEVPVNVMVRRLPGFLSDCDRTHPKVRVTGVAELMLDPSALLGTAGYVMGVKVNVAQPEDIVLKPDAAYLAARRDGRLVLAVEIALGALAVGVLVFAVVIFRQRRGIFRTRTIMAERKRMADDIHDTIEQHLVGAGMLLKLNRNKEAQDILVRAKREIRDIVWGLKNDDMMRLTPAEMLRKLAHEENTKGIYRVDTRLEGLPVAMDAAAMRDLSLIVRESIGNAVKHGGAKKIAISSDPLAGGGWKLRVSNDGTPFDPKTSPGVSEGHFGLEGMRQRARRLGATVDFERRGVGMVLILEKRI